MRTGPTPKAPQRCKIRTEKRRSTTGILERGKEITHKDETQQHKEKEHSHTCWKRPTPRMPQIMQKAEMKKLKAMAE